MISKATYRTSVSVRLNGHAMRGSAALLFFAVVIPILVICGVITFDINRVLTERSGLQKAADQAALIGARSLPHTERAITAAVGVLKQEGIYQGAPWNGGRLVVSVTADQGTVHTSITMPLQASLASYFLDENELGVIAASSATTAPRIVDIFVDTSAYLAPPLTESGGDVLGADTAWGLAKLPPYCSNSRLTVEQRTACQTMRTAVRRGDFWPTAQFAQRNPIRFSGSVVPPLMVTQQCFNPALSAIKEAALRIYEFTATSPMNQVGVAVGPSSSGGATSLKDIGRGDKISTYPSLVEGGISDSFCLAMSEEERSHTGYNVPPQASYTQGQSELSATIVKQGEGWTVLNPRDLSVRKGIWGRAVARRVGTNGVAEQIVDFEKVLEVMRRRVEGSLVRYASGVRPTYSSIILLGDLPYVDNTRVVPIGSGKLESRVWGTLVRELDQYKALAEREKVQISLLIVHFRHRGNYGELCGDQGVYDAYLPCGEFIDDSYALYRAVQSYIRSAPSQYFFVASAKVPDVSSLPQDALSLIPLFNHATIINR
jgi:Flp pilus assembly protein TadG